MHAQVRREDEVRKLVDQTVARPLRALLQFHACKGLCQCRMHGAVLHHKRLACDPMIDRLERS
jgi:hypothetical protein